MNFRKKQRPENIGFQLAPMLDVVFLLLCFFVTSQIFAQWETEVDVVLPTAQTGDMPQRLPGEIIINILEQGQIVITGRTLSSEQLEKTLQRLVENFPGQPVLIRADESADFKYVIGVLDQCRKNDISNISFATSTAGNAL